MEDKSLYSLIPKVDEFLESTIIQKHINDNNVPRKILLKAIREATDKIRFEIKTNSNEKEIKEKISKLFEEVIIQMNEGMEYSLKRVVNVTGVIIHTNLGRSLIDQHTAEHIVNIAKGYSNLEFDIETGERGLRYSHLEEIITDITGAEDCMVVNNNAAAVMLVLSTLAKGKEVIVSRGELIEIGGAFRIPDVMEQSGAILKEVGTTNKTHVSDYEIAINENTAAVMKIHTSNYRILGFTESVNIEELKHIKDKFNIPLVEDLGSGVLIDLEKYGIEHEPTVQESLEKGTDVVTFSGDKLLGGPQAGIIVGKKEYISAMKRNPLTRAFRVDKLTLAALEATIKLYYDEENAVKHVPTLRMLSENYEDIISRANLLKNEILKIVKNEIITISTEACESEVGGGSLPLEKLKSCAVVITLKDYSIQKLEELLRNYNTPIIVRINKDKIFMDVRTLQCDEISIIIEGLKNAFHEMGI